MSHFSVLVIGSDVEKQLAPYQENNMGDCPKEFLTFHDMEVENQKQYEEEDAETKAEYPTFANYLENYCGYKKDEALGKFGYWENPNRKWDYWCVGGRYSSRLLCKDGMARDSSPKGLIDFDLIKQQNFLNAGFSWDEGQSRPENIRGLLYGINAGETKEQFQARHNKSLTTFAVVKDGKWYERGSMGWFATVSNEKDESLWDVEFEKLLSEIPDETLLTVVDCHI